VIGYDVDSLEILCITFKVITSFWACNTEAVIGYDVDSLEILCITFKVIPSFWACNTEAGWDYLNNSITLFHRKTCRDETVSFADYYSVAPIY
jgi:predicted small secreted protein